MEKFSDNRSWLIHAPLFSPPELLRRCDRVSGHVKIASLFSINDSSPLLCHPVNKTNQKSTTAASYVWLWCTRLIYLPSLHTELHCCLENVITHQLDTAVHRVTCSSITMGTISFSPRSQYYKHPPAAVNTHQSAECALNRRWCSLGQMFQSQISKFGLRVIWFKLTVCFIWSSVAITSGSESERGRKSANVT